MTTKSEIQALSEAVDLLMVTISRQHAVMCWVMHSKLLLGLNWVQWALPETLHVPGLLLPTSFLIQPYILLKAGSALSSGDSTTSQGNLCHFLASWGNSPSCNPAWASLVSTTASSLFPPLHPTVKRLALSFQEHPCRTGQVAVGFLRALSPPGLISPAPSVSPHSACIPLLNSGHFVAGLCLQEKHGVMDEELEEHPKLCLTMLCPSEWHCVSRLQRAEMLGMLSLIPHTLLPKYILRWRQFTAPKLHIWDVFISGSNSEHPIGMYEPLCTFLSILCCRQVCGGITHLTGLYLGQGASLLLFFRSRKPHQRYTSRQRRNCKQDFGE